MLRTGETLKRRPRCQFLFLRLKKSLILTSRMSHHHCWKSNTSSKGTFDIVSSRQARNKVLMVVLRSKYVLEISPAYDRKMTAIRSKLQGRGGKLDPARNTHSGPGASPKHGHESPPIGRPLHEEVQNSAVYFAWYHISHKMTRSSMHLRL